MHPATEEFDAFVRGRSPALLRSAYLLTGDQYLAEDLVQSALARTHRSWRRLRDTGNAESYTRRTMYHLQVSWWRRRRVVEAFPGELPDTRSADDPIAGTDLRLLLRAALARLSPRQRAVLVLRYFEDLSVEETASALGCSTGTVKSQAARGLATLRKRLGPHFSELSISRTGPEGR